MPRRSKSLEFADLHCGIGSLRLAFEQIGGECECVWSHTSDAEAARCHAENFGDLRSADDIPVHDILVVNLDECRATAKKQSARRRYDMILDVVCLRRPLACLLAGRTDTARATSSPALIHDLLRLGYFVHRAMLDTRQFGLPHARLTEFLVAFDRETRFRFPTRQGRATGIDELLDPNPAERYYISDNDRENLIARRGRSVINGNKWHMGFVSGGCANGLRDAPDAPYGNIAVAPDGRWRVLTEREAARLQGIPDSLVLHPDRRTASKQVARCIPVPVAAAVAARIVTELRPGFDAGITRATAKVVGRGSRGRKSHGPRLRSESGAGNGCGSPLRWYGSLHGRSRDIAALFPGHECYCEVFGGGGAMLFAKQPSMIECYNDREASLVGLWRVLREPPLRERLIEMVKTTPLSGTDLDACLVGQDCADDPVTTAWLFLVSCNQPHYVGGVKESDCAWNKSMDGTNWSAWAKLPERVARVGQRPKRVQVESLAFEDAMRRYDSPETLFLLDPPSLPETRARGERYTHDCSRDDHVRLLRIARGVAGKVAACSPRNGLYDGMLEGWHRTDFEGESFSGRRRKGHKPPARVLSVYTNYDPPSR